MKFEYTGRHIEVTPALRQHVEQHFGRLSHLFDGHGLTAHTIIEVDKGGHRAEVIVKWRSEVLTATTTAADMYQSLSKTIDKIEKQALKIKNKVIDKKQRVSRKTKPAVESDHDDAAADGATPKIISARRYDIKPMTPEEAAFKLKHDENQFLVYRDAGDERVRVIYKRKDGNYGLIQP